MAHSIRANFPSKEEHITPGLFGSGSCRARGGELLKLVRLIRSNRSLIYPLLVSVCRGAERLSGMSAARRRLGRYAAVEIIVFSSVVVGALLVGLSDRIPRTTLVCLVILYSMRIVTMMIAHVSILLLNLGKSTPGVRVHSRIRYLALTFLNLTEIVLFGTLLMLSTLSPFAGNRDFRQPFMSISQILFYNLNSALGFSTAGIEPISPAAFAHSALILLTGLVLIVVVLAIVLAIRPEDEAVDVRDLDEAWNPEEYWSWRAQHLSDIPWVRDDGLRSAVIRNLPATGVAEVVDLGCGVGHLTASLASNGFRVHGIDNCPDMIRLARRNCKSPSVDFIEGSAYALPFSDGSIDAVVMRMLLHNLEKDLRSALLEAKRVLRNSGRLLIVEGYPPHDSCWSFFVDTLAKVHKRHFFREAQLRAELAACGFDIVSIERAVVKDTSVRAWLDAAVPDESLRETILQMHADMKADERCFYNARSMPDGDVMIDLTFLVINAKRT